MIVNYVNFYITLIDGMKMKWHVIYDDMQSLLSQIDDPKVGELTFRVFDEADTVSREWLKKDQIAHFSLTTSPPKTWEINTDIDINMGALIKEEPESGANE